MVNSPNMEKEIEALLSDEKVMRILSLLNDRTCALEPIPDTQYGFRYTLVEETLGLDTPSSQKLLEMMHRAGLLERKPVRKELACPNCGSYNLSTYYVCPNCGSFNITRRALIEHVSCGNIDVSDTFQRDGELVCPKCRSKLTDSSYKKAGIWMECDSCRRRIVSPNPFHICRSCGSSFSFIDAKYDDLFGYTLSSKAKEFVSHAKLRLTLSTILSESGYEVLPTKTLKGSSGVEHSLDLIARNSSGKRMGIEVTIAERLINQQEVLRWFIKLLDLKDQLEVYFIAVPGMDEEAKKLVVAYNLRVLEAPSIEEALSRVESVLQPTEKKQSSTVRLSDAENLQKDRARA